MTGVSTWTVVMKKRKVYNSSIDGCAAAVDIVLAEILEEK